MEVSVYGPAQDFTLWFFGGAVVNPVTILARLIASLHDSNEHITISGFYDDVKPLSDWEKEAGISSIQWSKLKILSGCLL